LLAIGWFSHVDGNRSTRRLFDEFPQIESETVQPEQRLAPKLTNIVIFGPRPLPNEGNCAKGLAHA